MSLRLSSLGLDVYHIIYSMMYGYSSRVHTPERIGATENVAGAKWIISHGKWSQSDINKCFAAAGESSGMIRSYLFDMIEMDARALKYLVIEDIERGYDIEHTVVYRKFSIILGRALWQHETYFISAAARSGNIASFHFFFKTHPLDALCAEDLLGEAAKSGGREIFDFLLSKGANPLSSAGLSGAAKSGDYHMIKYVFELWLENGVELTHPGIYIIKAAASAKNLGALRWILENYKLNYYDVQQLRDMERPEIDALLIKYKCLSY